MPIPVTRDIDVDPNDVVIYDQEGYPALKKFLQDNGIRHILLTGYATDMCYARTCAGYENLSKDFNVFLVGDTTLATFPAAATPKFTTSAHISFCIAKSIGYTNFVDSLSTGETNNEKSFAQKISSNDGCREWRFDA